MCSITCGLAVALTTKAYGQSSTGVANDVERGYSIAESSDISDAGFGDSTAKVTMKIYGQAKQPIIRLLTMTTLERQSADEGDKSLIVFHKPRDISGTALLSHARIHGNDRQWLLLRSLGRVKRISSANKRGPFVSSEFTFEDLTGQELKKYSFNYLGSEDLAGILCHVVKRIPTYAGSAYDSQNVWYSDVDKQPRMIQFFDDHDDLTKTLVLESYRKFGDYWRPLLMTMTNHKSKRSTSLEFESYRFGQGLSARDFEKAALLDL